MIIRRITHLAMRWLCLLAIVATAEGAHTVRRGETLYSIARENGITVARLMSANNIKDATALQVGRRLTIPSSSSSSASSNSSSSSSSKSSSSSSSRASTPSRAAGSKGLVIVIDPGHGGRDKGAVWGGVRESDLNLNTANKLEYYLRRAGYKTVMTRRSDTYLSLVKRAGIANSYRNALFVSIHYNATRETWVHGGETFHSGSRQGRYLASSIQTNLAQNCRVKSRGARYGRFTVLHNTNCPAVLVECGFISNSAERARCKTSSFQDAAARAILSGIERYDRAY